MGVTTNAPQGYISHASGGEVSPLVGQGIPPSQEREETGSGQFNVSPKIVNMLNNKLGTAKISGTKYIAGNIIPTGAPSDCVLIHNMLWYINEQNYYTVIFAKSPSTQLIWYDVLDNNNNLASITRFGVINPTPQQVVNPITNAIENVRSTGASIRPANYNTVDQDIKTTTFQQVGDVMHLTFPWAYNSLCPTIYYNANIPAAQYYRPLSYVGSMWYYQDYLPLQSWDNTISGQVIQTNTANIPTTWADTYRVLRTQPANSTNTQCRAMLYSNDYSEASSGAYPLRTPTTKGYSSQFTLQIFNSNNLAIVAYNDITGARTTSYLGGDYMVCLVNNFSFGEFSNPTTLMSVDAFISNASTQGTTDTPESPGTTSAWLFTTTSTTISSNSPGSYVFYFLQSPVTSQTTLSSSTLPIPTFNPILANELVSPPPVGYTNSVQYVIFALNASYILNTNGTNFDSSVQSCNIQLAYDNGVPAGGGDAASNANAAGIVGSCFYLVGSLPAPNSAGDSTSVSSIQNVYAGSNFLVMYPDTSYVSVSQPNQCSCLQSQSINNIYSPFNYPATIFSQGGRFLNYGILTSQASDPNSPWMEVWNNPSSDSPRYSLGANNSVYMISANSIRPLSASQATFNQESVSIGASYPIPTANVPPSKVGSVGVFAGLNSKNLWAIQFSLIQGQPIVIDLTKTTPNILDAGVSQLISIQTPFPRFFLLLTDGSIAICTVNIDNNIAPKWSTWRDPFGKVVSLSSANTDNGTVVSMIINRNGLICVETWQDLYVEQSFSQDTQLTVLRATQIVPEANIIDSNGVLYMPVVATANKQVVYAYNNASPSKMYMIGVQDVKNQQIQLPPLNITYDNYVCGLPICSMYGIFLPSLWQSGYLAYQARMQRIVFGASYIQNQGLSLIWSDGDNYYSTLEDATNFTNGSKLKDFLEQNSYFLDPDGVPVRYQNNIVNQGADAFQSTSVAVNDHIPPVVSTVAELNLATLDYKGVRIFPVLVGNSLVFSTLYSINQIMLSADPYPR